MKKAISIIMALAMVFIMAIPSFASNTTISTVVPDEHTVTVVYNDGGYVLVNGKLCPDGTQFKINRFGEIDLGAVFKNGYHLDTIEINGTDVTNQYIDGNLKITDINTDILVEFTFEKCSDDANDKCGKVDIEGTVYFGDKELKDATLSFDFGSVTAKTNADGRYSVEDIADGKHLVQISKDGEVLANTSFVIVRADVDEPELTTASDGTQVVVVPLDADKIYLDFHILDNNNDGKPDIDPDDTDPGDPDNPDFEDPDGDPTDTPDGSDPDDDTPGSTPDDDPDGKPETDPKDEDKDGVIITIGGPVKPTPIIPIPDTFVEVFENPVIMGSVMGLSLFFFILIIFKRKKDEEDEREIIAE